MNFYHLTRNGRLAGFVATFDRRARKGKYHKPLECKVHGPEAHDARICVAPTVWQCFTSMTDRHTLFIYRLECEGAFQPSAEHNVLDADISQEYWITDDVIGQNDGLIRVHQVGFLNRDFLMEWRFRISDWRREHSVAPASLDEMEHLWVVDTSQTPHEWKLREDVGPKPSDEPEEPLGIPVWDWHKSPDEQGQK